MKREETLLNLICIIAAAGFLALVVYNFFAAGSVITIDGLFFTVVPLVLALFFISVPAKGFVSQKLEQRALKVGGEQKQIGAVAGGPSATRTVPALKDVKGRPMPPDVNRIVAELNAPRTKSS